MAAAAAPVGIRRARRMPVPSWARKERSEELKSRYTQVANSMLDDLVITERVTWVEYRILMLIWRNTFGAKGRPRYYLASREGIADALSISVEAVYGTLDRLGGEHPLIEVRSEGPYDGYRVRAENTKFLPEREQRKLERDRKPAQSDEDPHRVEGGVIQPGSRRHMAFDSLPGFDPDDEPMRGIAIECGKENRCPIEVVSASIDKETHTVIVTVRDRSEGEEKEDPTCTRVQVEDTGPQPNPSPPGSKRALEKERSQRMFEAFTMAYDLGGRPLGKTALQCKSLWALEDAATQQAILDDVVQRFDSIWRTPGFTMPGLKYLTIREWEKNPLTKRKLASPDRKKTREEEYQAHRAFGREHGFDK